ncbi:MAG: hypothetical protein ACJ8IQ_00225 [Chthoniobacterales bacterium]
MSPLTIRLTIVSTNLTSDGRANNARRKPFAIAPKFHPAIL